MDRQWIRSRDRFTHEYSEGIDSFIEIARQHVNEKNETLCPCKKCMNTYWWPVDLVYVHLVQHGMSVTYDRWVYHGEQIDMSCPNQSSTSPQPITEAHNVMLDMIGDVFHGMDVDQDVLGDDLDILWEGCTSGGSETSNNFEYMADFNNYEKLLSEAQRELYPGCTEFTVLSFVVELLNCKVDNLWTQKSVNMNLGIMRRMCPKPNNIPVSYNECKKLLKGLGMGYENIHACKYDCILYYKEHAGKDKCPVCNEPRYKNSDRKQKKMVPQKVLRYLPLKPRLQRLFMSRHTSSAMRWHKDQRIDEEGVMRHPADSPAWKEFDEKYPEFAADARNVRLGLATDGFNPFGNMSTSYSMWPVVVVPYNLPPWMCMKKPYSMLTLLIPGPKAPGRDLDVYMRPLIDELKELWGNGVKTYDRFSRSEFNMHAAVVWTINDFPAYANLSGWSTKGYLACPVCNEDTSATSITSKLCYTGHRRNLPDEHPWRHSKLFNGQVEMDPPPREFSGDDIVEQLRWIRPSKPGKHPSNTDLKREREPFELNWTKKSIFFELEYWSSLKIRHNLDVMHTEKNIIDNIIGTLLNIEGKSKDTYKGRMDLKNMKIRRNLWLKPKKGKGKIGKEVPMDKPLAEYVLTPPQRRAFCEFLKSVKFPDGYASNISHKVNVLEAKLTGIKSHDSHVLMQRLLPVGIRKFLKKSIYTPLVELSRFFQRICAKTLIVSDLEKLEENIVMILCKLEKIFPPSFFDVMVHLAVHLPKEARLAGPVAYRWMYPIERLLGTYKSYVRNKARPDGSIIEAYIAKESVTYCSMYLLDVETALNRPQRNDDGGQPNAKISVFAQKARPFGRHLMVELSHQEKDEVYWYILNNCDEIESFREEHKEMLCREGSPNLAQTHMQLFPAWFRKRVNELHGQGSALVNEELYALAQGPDLRSVHYPGCMVNRVRWSINQIEAYRTTQNSAVRTLGAHDGEDIWFYGSLLSVVKVQFMKYHVILFKCKWYNTDRKKKRIVHDMHLTSVKVNSLWYKDDPYVLATQAHQMFYMDDPKLGVGWKVVQKNDHRHLLDLPEKQNSADDDEDESSDDDDDMELDSHDSGNEEEDKDEDDDNYDDHNDDSGASLCRNNIAPEVVLVSNANLPNMPNDDFIDNDLEEAYVPSDVEESDSYSDLE